MQGKEEGTGESQEEHQREVKDEALVAKRSISVKEDMEIAVVEDIH